MTVMRIAKGIHLTFCPWVECFLTPIWSQWERQCGRGRMPHSLLYWLSWASVLCKRFTLPLAVSSRIPQIFQPKCSCLIIILALLRGRQKSGNLVVYLADVTPWITFKWSTYLLLLFPKDTMGHVVYSSDMSERKKKEQNQKSKKTSYL